MANATFTPKAHKAFGCCVGLILALGACHLLSRERWELRNEIHDGPFTVRIEFIDHSSGFPHDEEFEYRVLFSANAAKSFEQVSTGVFHDDLPFASGVPPAVFETPG